MSNANHTGVTMQTIDQARSTYTAISTAADLITFSGALTDSNLLDESGQTTAFGPEGPLAPWSIPNAATIVDDDGEDVVITIGGEHVRWRNDRREWSVMDASDIADLS